MPNESSMEIVFKHAYPSSLFETLLVFIKRQTTLYEAAYWKVKWKTLFWSFNCKTNFQAAAIMPKDDINKPIPDLTDYINEGNIFIDRKC